MRNNPVMDPAWLLTSDSNERRAIAQRAEMDRVESRQRELDTQCSPEFLPEERIRIWERLHGLSLPQAEKHPLLAVIAEQTQLSIRDIRDEQGRRRPIPTRA